MQPSDYAQVLITALSSGGITLLFIRLYYMQLNKTHDAKVAELNQRLLAIETRLKQLEEASNEATRRWEQKVSYKSCTEFRNMEKQINEKQFTAISTQLERVESKLDRILIGKEGK